MKSHLHTLSVALLAMVGLLGTVPELWASPFSQAKIIIEVNASAGDGGIQISVDGVGWNRLEVFDPDGQKIFDVRGSNSVGVTGITELFFESAEPSFEDLPLDQLLDRFPEGNYQFNGITVEGRRLTGKATLKHNIPAGPVISSPPDEVTLSPSVPVIIDWDPVTDAFVGTDLPVTIVGYQVIVERVKPQPLLVFSVTLPATVTQVTVPGEFIQANADYKFEVLAIEVDDCLASDSTVRGPWHSRSSSSSRFGAESAFSASSVTPSIDFPVRLWCLATKCDTSAGMSSRLARSGGSSIGMTLRR